MKNNTITIQTVVDAPVADVWECWTKPEHISRWAFASDDWEALAKENDVREGGRFNTVMSAKDKSASFEFAGIYTHVSEYARIEFTMDDGRDVTVLFESIDDNHTKVTETFEPETENPEDVQRDGWQTILDNFKAYVEKRI